MTAPFLQRTGENSYRLKYVWSDREFHDREVIDAIAAHPNSGALGRMMAEVDHWNMPDFRPWTRTFQLGAQSLPVNSEVE